MKSWSAAVWVAFLATSVSAQVAGGLVRAVGAGPAGSATGPGRARAVAARHDAGSAPAPDAGVEPDDGAARLGGAFRGRVRVVSLTGDPRGWVATVARALRGLGPQDVLVLRIRSLGGSLAGARRVCDRLLGFEGLSVGLVESQAVGAAALVALCSRVVAMAPRARIGAADTTQFQSGELTRRERAAGLRLAGRLARRRGLPEPLLAAMVDPEVAFDWKKVAGHVPEGPEGLSGNQKGRLLWLDGRTAKAVGLARFVVGGLEDLLGRLGLADREYEVDGRIHAPFRPGRGDARAASRSRDPAKMVRGVRRVVVVEIHGTIDLGLAPFVKRVLKGVGPKDLVILDVDTFGGRVDAAVQIRDALLSTRARTVAFVNRRAISAGALISLACDIIAMTPGASMGAATPVQLSGGKMKPTEEKVVSYMRKEMKATAEAKGRRGDIAEAMVDRDVEVQNVDPRLKRTIVGLKKGKLLTLTTSEALALGMADLETSSLEDLLAKLHAEGLPVLRPKVNWAERVARFLTDPIVSSLLLTLGLLGLILELYTPGLGLAGAFGLVCLVLFFFGHMVVNLAGWGHLVLFLVGAALLAVEVFLTPGFGFIGGSGIALIVVSLVWALSGLRTVPWRVAWNLGYVTRALAMVFGSVAVTAVLAFVAIRYLPRTKVLRPMVLEVETGAAEAAPAPSDDFEGLEPGTEGVAETVLRPAGKVRFGRRLVSALSDGAYVAAGSRVRLLRVESGRAVVRLVDEEEGQQGPAGEEAVGQGRKGGEGA